MMATKNNDVIPTQDRENWLKVPELAQRAGLSRQKIRNLIEEGKIVAYRLGNGYYRIPRVEAERFLAEGFKYEPTRAN